MADANGSEAGVAFLAENKNKPGVVNIPNVFRVSTESKCVPCFSLRFNLQVTLPSGLQYKVLEEGPGMDHPKVHTPPLMYMI
jgi:hypothetical protein